MFSTTISFYWFSHIHPLILLYLLGSPYVDIIKPVSCTSSPTATCIEMERKALLSFRESLTDPSGRLSSWVGDDCCKWRGVGCNNQTGHVFKLDLRNPFQFSQDPYDDYRETLPYDDYRETDPHHHTERALFNRSCLGGEINPSLLQLKRLSYLDLSLNNFNGNQIPKFVGSLQSLRYLNLSFSSFSGIIPPHLGNLSTLLYLDLYAFSYSTTWYGPLLELEVESLQWLVGLSSLKHLNMGWVNLERAGPFWLQAVNMLTSLLELHLPNSSPVSLPHSVSSINITSLSVLDLSDNYFNSSIPQWLSNITGLRILNLKWNFLRGVIPDGLANLGSLEELDLSCNFNIEGELPASLGYLQNLRRLDLSDNHITGKIPSSFGNFCNLQMLNLFHNRLIGEISEFVDGLSRCTNDSLESLYLGGNVPSGNRPNSFGGLNQLTEMDLSSNFFWGSIPESIGNLSSLERLEVNHMHGNIPESIGKLSMLVILNLGLHSLRGVLTEAHFQNHHRLKYLDLEREDRTNKTLVLDVKYGWLPPFKLTYAALGYIRIGPKFPAWLQTQNELEYLSLDNVGIADTTPMWFWKSFSNITHLSMAKNKLCGMVPPLQVSPGADYFDLSSNNLEGPLPLFPGNFTTIKLANNFFSGHIPENIGEILPRLEYLDLSSNVIHGRIPPSIGNIQELLVLALKNNFLSGELPSNWEDLQILWVLDLTNNSLSGKVPVSLAFLSSLQLLYLSKNHLEGELPCSFKNLTSLLILDLGENSFSGNLPAWVGESLSSLLMLRLRSNFFNGEIPQQLCLLSDLQLLDLGNNDFSGAIPQCLGNLSKKVVNESLSNYLEMAVVSKGREYVYGRTLRLVNSLDLSDNNLSGEIPENISSLIGLRILNVSMNHLTGKIPEKLGNLHMLESLDLCRNRLSGPIPESFSSLTFLSYLNLSYNDLSGKIPSRNQLQTLDDSTIYEGNPLLCGFPLGTLCPGDEADLRPTSNGGNEEGDDGEKGIQMSPFYISMIAGFFVGFWGVCGTLIIKSSWRHAYFRLVDKVKDDITVYVIVNVARLQRKIKLERN